MSAPKNRTKGAFMGPLWEKPRQKGRTTAMFAQKARDSGIGGFLSSATVSYSDHPLLADGFQNLSPISVQWLTQNVLLFEDC